MKIFYWSQSKKIFNKLVDEKFDEIAKLDEKVNLDDLIYRYKGKTPDENFDTYDNALKLIDKIENGKIKLAEAKKWSNKIQIEFRRNKKRKQQRKINRSKRRVIEMLYKARNETVKLYDDYSLMVSEAKNKAINETKNEGKGLKILTPKQMLQRLPITLAQVKAGNNSESLLNEIRKIVYSLYQSKEITKKVYNNIIKSIQL